MDVLVLEAAIKQAELGGALIETVTLRLEGLPPSDLLGAKRCRLRFCFGGCPRHLDALNARQHARQELHLARTSGRSAESLQIFTGASQGILTRY